MNLTTERGAIPIIVDRPRILFFGMVGTFHLVNHYDSNFVTELYSVQDAGDGKSNLKLKSAEALAFFLWAGLQEEIAGTDEKLTIEQVRNFIRPWTVRNLFNSLVMALTGAIATPQAPAGKDGAAAPTAKRAAKKTPKKVSTLKTRSGSRMAR